MFENVRKDQVSATLNQNISKTLAELEWAWQKFTKQFTWDNEKEVQVWGRQNKIQII